MEELMKPLPRFVAIVAPLVLLLHNTPSWGQPVCALPGCNPTTSNTNQNTAGGTGSLISVVSGAAGGFNNTAFGAHVLDSTTTGSANTAIGVDALGNNTTGSFNTASGISALLGNTTGQRNTAIGTSALFANSTGSLNTATGNLALFMNNTGTKNTAVGSEALNNSTGNKNIGIGYQAGTNLASGHNNIYIGSAGGGSSESQTIRVGTAQSQTFIAGINTAVVSGATVVVNGNGQLGIPASSARYKRDIEAMGTQSEKMLDLRPVTFAYTEDAAGVKHYGLIAEEVATVYPELVTRLATGEVQTVRYHELIPMLLNELQRQRQTLQKQGDLLQRQEQVLDRQQQELAELRALAGQGRGTASLSR